MSPVFLSDFGDNFDLEIFLGSEYCNVFEKWRKTNFFLIKTFSFCNNFA